jgi:hypothetical protein
VVLFNPLEKTNNPFLGHQKYIYRLSMLTGNGLIVIIGGYLEQQYGDKQKHGRIP